MSHTPRTPFSCSHEIIVGASIATPGTISVAPIHARTSRIGPKSQSAVESLCQPSSNTRIPRAVAASARTATVSCSSGTSQPPLPLADHLQVVAADRAELAGLDGSPQRAAAARRRGSSPSRAGRGRCGARRRSCAARSATSLDIGFCRFTCQPWSSSSITPSSCSGIGQQRLDRVDLEAAGRELGDRRERRASGQSALTLPRGAPRSGRRARPPRRRRCRRTPRTLRS